MMQDASMPQVKNILLWRHAEAEVLMHGEQDSARPLTKKGKTQAKQMSAWLKKYLPKGCQILVSPAIRAMQTAEALDKVWIVDDAIHPEATLLDVLAVLGQCQNESVMLVGHQPWIGELAASLLAIPDGQLSIKKGAVWWLRLPKSGPPYKLYSVQSTDLVV